MAIRYRAVCDLESCDTDVPAFVKTANRDGTITMPTYHVPTDWIHVGAGVEDRAFCSWTCVAAYAQGTPD